MFLAITSVGWGLNWPITKYLLSSVAAADVRGHDRRGRRACWRCYALLRGQSLRVPRDSSGRGWCWPRSSTSRCWMALMGLALLWLPASEAA